MTKPNQATIFRKRQVLTAKGLTKSLGEYGSQGGVIPFDANSEADTSHNLPLGTKENPFGNAFFKGLNLYTQAEVQELIEDGILTQTDRMVFWNLTTNTLCAWNGTEIVSLTGSNDNMKYLFGNEIDGDVTMVANGSFSEPKNFRRFTLNEGITLSSTTSILIIRCTENCTINGIINMSGKGFAQNVGYSTEMRTWIGGIKSGGAGGNSSANAGGAGAGCGGGGGAGTSVTKYYGGAGNDFDSSMNLFLAQQLELEKLLLVGGGGGSFYQNNNGTVSQAAGGTGGGGVLIIAPIITFGNSAQIVSNGTAGATGSSSGASGGGGGGGAAIMICNSITGTPTTSFVGANGGTYGGKGGNGGYLQVIIP